MSVTSLRVPYEADIAPAAALLADSTRAVMLQALLDGRPLAAGELARIAGVSAATASAHLAKLLDGGMITCMRQGRHRYYRLSGHEVAAALEAISLISKDIPVRSLRQSREAAALAGARTCYDHLAGQAGVELFQALLRSGILQEQSYGTERGDPHNATLDVTAAGTETLLSFGINVGELRRGRRRFAGTCLDWTQRSRHLNGALAAAITARLFELGWIECGQRRRAVVVTPLGRQGLAGTFGCVTRGGRPEGDPPEPPRPLRSPAVASPPPL
ncbi:MAG: winged helix-turn-helix transcriptional regulator [Streptosporangiaceae bacterium]|nr:winged helix-turn-helix transcriptional regulator [Streptosporangiaceae bacterium]MBV9853265.1 winged helix-turn-helix transcriptional regulator [Streptosporangiaceae bacterium]